MIVGIDLGATKTHVLAERDGEIFDEFVTATKDLLGDRPVDDSVSIRNLVKMLSRVEPAQDAVVVIGAHGLDSPEQCLTFAELLQEAQKSPVLAVNDAELLGPAAGFEDSIAVVVGTGSKVVSHNSHGETISAGGFGHFFSDAGSAGGLVREAMRAILDRCDAGLPLETLGSLLVERLGAIDEVDLAQMLTSDPRLSSWAPLAPIVFDAVAAGSELGTAVISAAAGALATNVAQVVARGAVGSHVVCAGGVIARQPSFFAELKGQVEQFDLGLEVELLAVAPVRGAIALGTQMRA